MAVARGSPMALDRVISGGRAEQVEGAAANAVSSVAVMLMLLAHCNLDRMRGHLLMMAWSRQESCCTRRELVLVRCTLGYPVA